MSEQTSERERESEDRWEPWMGLWANLCPREIVDYTDAQLEALRQWVVSVTES